MHRRSNDRSGITLTEILIAIMILGIGMVSVATLFPIGLLRLRDATRDARSTILAMSAKDDAEVRGLPRSLGDAKGLVNPESFVHPNLPWYPEWRAANFAGFPFAITPLTYDYDTINGTPNTGVSSDFFAPGLPVAYDPLFWATTHFQTEGFAPEHTPLGLRGNLGSEGRFGSGIGYLRAGTAAHGLQRITNFEAYNAGIPWPYTYSLPSTPAALQAIAEVAGNVFTSLDDPVVTGDTSGRSGVPVVPFNLLPTGTGYASEREYAFSWMLTGRLGVAGDPSIFEGNIVVFHSRPIGMNDDPNTGLLVPSGERTVEAIWGYTSTPNAVSPIPNPIPAVAGTGYSSADDRTVLLRWPAASPDPIVNVGNFIADVTYARFQADSNTFYPRTIPGTGRNGAQYSGQRIHWYRIVQKGEVEPDPVATAATNEPYLRIIVRVDTPLQAKTRLLASGESVVPEAALICPYVVNVFPVMLYSR
ncbi:type II secretion system protein [Tautonia sp. JC769]|uniref:type IV pilus modification PilV family protein n=1 Tax=Tautonia sp. JC769 TaxID=3232135 RepID=UPI00345A264D